MSYLWVKYLDTRPVEINVTNCRNVDGFIRLVKDELGSLKDTPLENITIHTSKETPSPIDPGIPISDIKKEPRYQENDSIHPLIVKVAIPDKIKQMNLDLDSLLEDTEKLHIDRKNLLKFKWAQKGSSNFTSSSKNDLPCILFCGPTQTRFNKHEIEQIDPIASQIEEARRFVRLTYCFDWGHKSVAEVNQTKSRNSNTPDITTVMNNYLTQYFSNSGLKCSVSCTLDDFENTDVGACTSASKADFVAYAEYEIDGGKTKKIALLNAEYKGSSYSTFEQLGQSVAIGSNLATAQFLSGMKASDVAIPLILTNGMISQFAVVTLLKGGLPVARLCSRIFDSIVDIDEIAMWFARIKLFIQTQAEKIADGHRNGSDNDEDSINFYDEYFLKPCCRISRRYDDSISSQTKECGFSGAYLLQIFDLLNDMDEVVKPFGVGMLEVDSDAIDPYFSIGNERSAREYMVFPRMKDYEIGLPVEDITSYVQRLVAVVKKMHERGVVHLDLYPSNIMWQKDGNDFKICLIDFDNATVIDDTFTSTMKANLYGTNGLRPKCLNSVGKAIPLWDAWNVFTFTTFDESTRAQIRGDAANVNQEYNKAVEKLLRTHRNIEHEFTTWFSDNWNSN